MIRQLLVNGILKPGKFNANRNIHSDKKLLGQWELKKSAKISEFNMTASILQHEGGSEFLHVERDDPNATFSVGFRTVPQDSSGLPHILEHTVLCGSERFPCRDPFFNMLSRSLATFMNALTAPDATMYPFSSLNKQDCRNLQSVYLDAVFQPKLDPKDFQQEGWRLEHEDPNDPSTPIILKGVVYNEMKGVFSDNQNLYGEELLNNLLPVAYGVCSGGLPKEIPTLRHEDLVQFHRRHYTPRNAKFFLYGKLPLEELLAGVEPYLKEKGSDIPLVRAEPRWSAPRRKHVVCRCVYLIYIHAYMGFIWSKQVRRYQVNGYKIWHAGIRICLRGTSASMRFYN